MKNYALNINEPKFLLCVNRNEYILFNFCEQNCMLFSRMIEYTHAHIHAHTYVRAHTHTYTYSQTYTHA